MTDKDLIISAIDAMNFSYSPYSSFSVGAALLCSDGTVYLGTNIENAAYTPTVCAERVAFFKAISEGKREFSKIAIVGGKNGKLADYCTPCGVCRQVMAEFCNSDFEIISAKSESDYKAFTLKELLPQAFSPKSLK